jgi:predicted ArsR family transcriptional regulator
MATRLPQHNPLDSLPNEGHGPSLPALHGTDEPVVELLRGDVALGVSELSDALGVTATAVRQRLTRLMEVGFVVRERSEASGVAGRGRPSHVYRLSEAGRQLGGDNFRDLAMVLWREVRRIEEPTVRRGLLSRIGRSLADVCRARNGAFEAAESPVSRLAVAAAVLREQNIACECTAGGTTQHGCETGAAGEQLAVLTTHTCPYPQLAEADRGICAAERVMLEALVEAPVRLAECRLDGDACCRFTVHAVRQQSVASGKRQRKEA